MRELLNKLAVMLVMLTLCVGMASCSGDDEPSYDPQNPVVGTWIVDNVSGWNYQGYIGQLLIDAEQSARDFSEEWLGKSIKVTSKTKIEDDKIILDETSYREEFLEIGTITENSMSVHYVLITYLSNGDRHAKTTASMQLIRK